MSIDLLLLYFFFNHASLIGSRNIIVFGVLDSLLVYKLYNLHTIDFSEEVVLKFDIGIFFSKTP